MLTPVKIQLVSLLANVPVKLLLFVVSVQKEAESKVKLADNVDNWA